MTQTHVQNVCTYSIEVDSVFRPPPAALQWPTVTLTGHSVWVCDGCIPRPVLLKTCWCGFNRLDLQHLLSRRISLNSSFFEETTGLSQPVTLCVVGWQATEGVMGLATCLL